MPLLSSSLSSRAGWLSAPFYANSCHLHANCGYFPIRMFYSDLLLSVICHAHIVDLQTKWIHVASVHLFELSVLWPQPHAVHISIPVSHTPIFGAFADHGYIPGILPLVNGAHSFPHPSERHNYTNIILHYSTAYFH